MSVHPSVQRRREYDGPALLSYGFRPFFLFAGIWAVISLPLWLHQFYGDVTLPTYFAPLDWHIHEMLFGYTTAAIAGFLLTAIPNWTGRLPVSGWSLAGLAAIWLAGRVAIMFSAKIGSTISAFVDVAFLLCLTFVAAREIVAGKNWRNLRVLAVLVTLGSGNIVFHAEAIIRGSANYGTRIAIAAVIVLVSVIGGRIIPSFTNNWLARENPGRLPIPFSRFDVLAIAATILALLAWIVAPEQPAVGSLLLLVGLLHVIRLARWAGHRTFASPLVLVLHVAYAFLAAGFLMVALSTFASAVPQTAGIHAWTAGTIGLMTLAVMTRATLGHTGQALSATLVTQAIYALVFAATILRIAAAFSASLDLVRGAAICWLLGFGLFVLSYGRLLLRPKVLSVTR